MWVFPLGCHSVILSGLFVHPQCFTLKLSSGGRYLTFTYLLSFHKFLPSSMLRPTFSLIVIPLLTANLLHFSTFCPSTALPTTQYIQFTLLLSNLPLHSSLAPFIIYTYLLLPSVLLLLACLKDTFKDLLFPSTQNSNRIVHVRVFVCVRVSVWGGWGYVQYCAVAWLFSLLSWCMVSSKCNHKMKVLRTFILCILSYTVVSLFFLFIQIQCVNMWDKWLPGDLCVSLPLAQWPLRSTPALSQL